MADATTRVTRKHFRLDVSKLKRAQKLLAAATETETIERALDLVIEKGERNRLVAEVNLRAYRDLRSVSLSSRDRSARMPSPGVSSDGNMP
jgi:hypothetical protein